MPDPEDVCEEAARYREMCLGDYVTPPVCDEDAAAAAGQLLGLSCEEVGKLHSPGKADGAFCDWFGTGCTPDEAIFTGPVCSDDASCGEGFCAEGHCFGGVLSEDLTKMLDAWTGTAWEREAGCPNADKYGLACPDAEEVLDDFMLYPTLDEVGEARTRAIYSDPYNQPTPHGYLTTLALVRSARTSITLSNSYFVPPRRLRKHLLAAVARGVKVTVLTNSKESTDAWWMYYASLNYYQELISGGVVIHQYRGTETMHSKTMLIDDELAVVGSYNLDPRSAVDNSESMLVIRNGETVRELREAMDVDLAYSDVASSKISLIDKAKAKAFRLAEPLL